MSSKALVNGIVTQLRRDILRGVLKPGDPVKERDKAAEMGVSRTPMREAIRVLSEEGLVTLRHARSPIVSIPDPKTASDQTEVLVTLEKLSAKLACRHATQTELEKVEAILDDMTNNFFKVDAITMFEADMSFHSAIAEASHNASLSETHTLYLQRLWYPRYLAASKRRSRDRVISEHTDVMTALKSRDENAAQAAIETHLLNLTGDIVEQVNLINQNNGSPDTGERETR